jgi:hypothetical protein
VVLFGEIIIFAFDAIIAKYHQANSNGGEDGNDDNPWYRFVNVFCAGAADVVYSTHYQQVYNCWRNNYPDKTHDSLKQVHTKNLFINIFIHFIIQIQSPNYKTQSSHTNWIPKPYQWVVYKG